MKKIKDYSLYLVLSQQYLQKVNILEVAETAIAAGIDILQMREKDKSYQELLYLGKKISSFCKDSDTLFIVNDLPSLAKEVDADGIHLGQEDIKKLSLKTTRDIIGKDKIIGLSTHSIEQFKEAMMSDCNYIAFGPVFATHAKDYSIGTADIEQILQIANKPVILIGGINLSNIDVLLQKGAKNIALMRALLEVEDTSQSIKDFKNRINQYRSTFSP